MNICVVALGQIGLPLAVQFASKGHAVTGVDVNARTVDLVNAGIEPFPGEADLDEKLPLAVSAGLLRATTDYGDAVPEVDAVLIVVPLFVDDATWEPDFGWMDAATGDVAANLTPGTVVSYETTLPVGTTRHRWKHMLEDGSGLVEGRDFHLVFSPERVLTGRVFADLRKYPKLVGGLSAEGALGSIEGVRVAVLGAAYRGGVEETASSGDFTTVEALMARDAAPVVHDPMYDDSELEKLRLVPYPLGSPVDAAVIQADHAEYKHIRPADLPGIRVLVDGRAVTDETLWRVRPLVVGTAPGRGE